MSRQEKITQKKTLTKQPTTTHEYFKYNCQLIFTNNGSKWYVSKISHIKTPTKKHG